ncbi:MAG: LL-diaminopimelate aminotransferase [Ktedonobacterales bacterium]
MELSNRLKNLPPYHFAEYGRKIAALRAAGVDIIDLSIGDPDLATPPAVLERLRETAGDPINQRYPEYAGMPQLRSAIAAWFARRFDVELDPAREIVPLIGSKEGLAHLPLAVMDPGDVALMPDPNYPVYPTAVALAGGTCYTLPLEAARNWLPDLTAVPADIARKARTLWLNYPNNPTGASAPLDFFAQAVAFAREYDLLLIHDMAYAEVTFDGVRPPSILQVPGAKDVAVELHSLSKAYNMAGFRIGMLVGNGVAAEGLARLKSNVDTGIFRPIQYAAIAALALPPEWLTERNAIYQRRRDRLVASCRRMGLDTAVPSAGLYLWPHIPAGQTSAQFALDLLDRTGVAVTPGTNFGTHGEGYLRIALTTPDARLDEAVARLEAAVATRA